MPPEDKRGVNTNLSCTFCGPGTWATWEVVTDGGVIFACDRHHVEMSEAKMIRLERMRGKKTWKEISQKTEIFYDEEYLDNLTDFQDMNDHEQGGITNEHRRRTD